MLSDDVIRLVMCPRCGAKQGEPCVTPTGRIVYHHPPKTGKKSFVPHSDRVRRYVGVFGMPHEQKQSDN